MQVTEAGVTFRYAPNLNFFLMLVPKTKQRPGLFNVVVLISITKIAARYEGRFVNDVTFQYYWTIIKGFKKIKRN